MITTEQLETIVPAAFSSQPAAHTSDQYKHIRTMDVVDRLIGEGFVVTQAQQQKAQKRTQHKIPHAKHRIRLKMPTTTGQLQVGKVGDIFPTVDLINSGDWSSLFIFAVGLFRIVCGNGMIAPFGSANTSFRIRHDRIDEDIVSAMNHAIDTAPALFQFARDCSDREVSPDEARAYATAAARLRFGIEDTDTPDPSMVIGLQKARRVEDTPNNLWTLFNRVQENGTRGGFQAPTANGRLRRVRAVSNIGRDTAFNQGLWNLTEEFLRNGS
jgi:hypothetical protein